MSKNMFTGSDDGYDESGGYVPRMIPHPGVAIVSLAKVKFEKIGKNATPKLDCYFVAQEPTEGLKGDFKGHQYVRNEFWLTEKAMSPEALGSCVKFFGILAENLGGPDTAEFQKKREANLKKWNKVCMELEPKDWDGYATAIMGFFEGKEFAGVIAGHWETKASDGKTIKKSLLHYKGTFARTVGEIETLEEYVKNNKDYLIQDDTVSNTVAGVGEPEQALDSDEDGDDW